MDSQEFEQYKAKVDYLYDLHRYAFLFIGVGLVGYLIFRQKQ